MTSHPFADVFPLLGTPELVALADDIKTNGLREPVWVFEQKVLDGRNRVAACKLIKIAPTCREFTGTREQAARFVWSLNFKRRHLTPSQAGACVVEFEDLLATFATLAKSVQRAGKGAGNSGGRGNKTLPSLEGKVSRAPTSAAKLGQQIGVSHATVERARALQKADPELLAAVKAGTITLSQARREVKAAEVTKRVSLPDAKYRVLYADPPWAYHDKADEGAVQAGGAARHYPSLSIADLCALPVSTLCEPNAVLFLWVTSPLLFESVAVIKAWGFSYRASFVWDKVKHNMGHYNSVRHEFLLVCVRGSCQPDVVKLFDSVVTEERTEHSVKPAVFRTLIDTIYPHGKRLELFARGEVPSGWDAYGFEASASR